jgi:hypothetical protein
MLIFVISVNENRIRLCRQKFYLAYLFMYLKVSLILHSLPSHWYNYLQTDVKILKQTRASNAVYL